jgi:hypothetical protein
MNELLSRLSSYHLFNYLLPGCLFAVVASKFTHHQVIQQNLVLGLFLYYFYGLVISRLGSLVLEPFLKRVRFLKFSDYGDFVIASRALQPSGGFGCFVGVLFGRDEMAMVK